MDGLEVVEPIKDLLTVKLSGRGEADYTKGAGGDGVIIMHLLLRLVTRKLLWAQIIVILP